MKCPLCGKEMEIGSVERIGLGGYDNKYYYIPEEYTDNPHKIKKLMEKKKIKVSINLANECTAWHCSECKKVIMMMDSEK